METSKNKVTRRDLLKKSLKTAGYVVPAMVFLSMGSLDSWASGYGKPKKSKRPKKRKHHHKH